jgi:retinol dehydrogenase-14
MSEGLMSGKLCLITGGSSGVGLATARGLARLGARLILVARDRERGERAAQAIRSESGNGDVEFLPCDLSLQREVTRLAHEIEERFPRLDVLANCAGRLSLRSELTEEGVERTLAVDYLDHFLLTNLLLDRLRAASPSRVITVAGSPSGLRRSRLRLEVLASGARLGGIQGAMQSALARLLFTFELARRLKGSGVTANAFHPGLVRTHLDRNLPWPMRLVLRLASPFLSAECPVSVMLASSPLVQECSGLLFAGNRPADMHVHAADLDTAGSLWEASERLTGVRVS